VCACKLQVQVGDVKERIYPNYKYVIVDAEAGRDEEWMGMGRDGEEKSVW